MRPSNSLIVNGVSCSNTFNSNVVWATDIVRCSFQMTVSSGRCAGSFKLQGSNDFATGLPPNQFNPTNWNDIGSTSVSCSSTATARSFLSPAVDIGYEYVRGVWSDASGGSADGVVSVRFVAKAL